MTGNDQSERARIREALDVSLIVEAAAGTGKTTELIERIVAVLRTGRTTIDKLVAVTFTRKAAGELKLRLRQELDQRRANVTGTERERLELAIVRLEEARIGTIHSFCADLLRERPVEAGLTPDFGELDETDARSVFERVFHRWAEDAMNAPTAGLRRALARTALWKGAEAPMDGIRREAWKIIEWRDFPAPWRTTPFARTEQIDDLVSLTHRLAAMALTSPNPGDALRQALNPAIAFSVGLERREAVRHRDHDSLEAALTALLRELRRNRRKGRGRFSDAFSRDDVLSTRGQLVGRLERFRLAAEADLAARLREELWALVPLYDEAKRRIGRLDFTDLLIRTRNLLRDDAESRIHFQRRFTHIFVDEFQDTDPLQAEILLLLSSGDPDIDDARRVSPVPGKLFLVGDPKQSIYRFRRADFALYRTLHDSLVSRGVEQVRLTRSFRSVPDIQRAINHAFGPEMADPASRTQPVYAPLEEVSSAIPGQPALIALPLGRPYGWSRVTRSAVDACLPDTTAAWIDWLLSDSGWRVRDPAAHDALVPVAPRHVALLFRRFVSWGTDVTRDYVQSLETRNVPHLLWGARSFHHREEVETLRVALSAIEWPDDELSVFAVLKGSLFAISDETLLRFKTVAGTLHPFGPPLDETDEALRPVAEALGVLANLHRARNHRPFVETIHGLLAAARAHAGFALRPAGNQVLANVYHVSDLARRYETRGGTSFRGFVEELTRDARSGEGADAPVLEEGADGVRIMTVHAAKGLEFPVVILADITANLTAATPDKHIDPARGLAAMRLMGCCPADLNQNASEEHQRDVSEGIRIAYVAATRARDVLVLPTVGDGPFDGWAGAMNRAFYPAPGQRSGSRTPEGCPRFGSDTVLERPPQATAQAADSVRPGLHRPGSGHYDVVWWDPGVLKLNQKVRFGILHEQMLTTEGQAARSMKDYREWKERREALLRAGSAETLQVFSPSDIDAPDLEGQLEAPEVALVPRPGDRPSGPRFGTLVHAVLRDAPEPASSEDVACLAAFHGRISAATEAEVSAATNAVLKALDHPLLRRAAAASRCYKEYPITFTLSSGRILDGVIDLLFEDAGVWHVVDFKTDADLTPRQTHYKKQIGWYVLAVTGAYGAPARGHLLGV